MSEMVERAAVAIVSWLNDRVDKGDLVLSAIAEIDCKVAARAALQAMREPTDTILEAGSRASNTYPAVPEGYVTAPVHRFVVTQMWRQMIDEALR